MNVERLNGFFECAAADNENLMNAFSLHGAPSWSAAPSFTSFFNEKQFFARLEIFRTSINATMDTCSMSDNDFLCQLN
jgi:hypothetical protein